MFSVMVSVLASSAVDRGIGSNQTRKKVFVPSPYNTHHSGQ